MLEALQAYAAQRRQPKEQFGKATRLFWVLVPAMVFQGGVHLLTESFHLRCVAQSLGLWVEENDGTQAAQLSAVHLHLPHLGDQFREYPVKYGTHTGPMCAVPLHHQSCGQYDAITHAYRPMGEGGDEQLVPSSLEQDHAVLKGQLHKMGDVLGPLNQLVELPICCLADAAHWVLRLGSSRGARRLDPQLGLQDALEGHLCWCPAGALHLVVCPLLGPLALFLHSLSFHATREAFLVAAVLAPVTLPLVDDAAPLLSAGVAQVLAHRALEEALATLAAASWRGVHAVGAGYGQPVLGSGGSGPCEGA